MADETKHTAGEFQVGDCGVENGYVDLYSDTGGGQHGVKYLGRSSAEDVGEDQALANAHLWAASPAMFELAKKIDYFGDALIAREFKAGSASVTELVSDARKAIALAEGGAQ